MFTDAHPALGGSFLRPPSQRSPPAAPRQPRGGAVRARLLKGPPAVRNASRRSGRAGNESSSPARGEGCGGLPGQPSAELGRPSPPSGAPGAACRVPGGAPCLRAQGAFAVGDAGGSGAPSRLGCLGRILLLKALRVAGARTCGEGCLRVNPEELPQVLGSLADYACALSGTVMVG